MRINLSIITPVYNEDKLLSKNIKNFVDFFQKRPEIDHFEIIISENGSKDKTLAIAKKIKKKYQFIELINLKEKSLGLALSYAIKKSKYPYLYFLPIDNPFRFMDYFGSIKNINRFDIIFSTKNHPQSVYKNKPLRKVASHIFSFLVKAIFHLPLTDTQGTFFAKREKLLSLLHYSTSKGPFFQTQLAIYAFKKGMHIQEFPVNYTTPYRRRSKISLIKDGSMLIFELLIEKLKIMKASLTPRREHLGRYYK